MRETPAQSPADPAAQHSPPSVLLSPSRLSAWLHLPRAVSRLTWRLLWITYFVLAAAFLLARHVLVPQVAAERARIEQALSAQIGLPVQLGAVQASWAGLRPQLRMDALRVFDQEGRAALVLPRVDATVAWRSLLHWRLELKRLEIVGPQLSIRREADGRLFVAGIDVGARGGGDNAFTDFVLSQNQILIRDARLEWTDLMRGAPALTLNRLALRLENNGDRHRFALLASPPQALATQLDLRGDLRGEAESALDDWRGALYLAVDNADLAVWQRWVDYPVSLPRGRGGVRAWLDFEGRKVVGLTTDLALADVALRISPELPQLDMNTLTGRLRLALGEGDYSITGERLGLVSRDGLVVAPTRFSFLQRAARDKEPARGEVTAERLDLNVMARLVAYLPLPQAWRERLVETAPQGRVEQLALRWQGAGEAPAKFGVAARFASLAMRPFGSLPGFTGLSGDVSGDEREGRFNFSFRDGALDAPAQMHDQHLPLDRADIAGTWAREPSKTAPEPLLTVRLTRATVANPDISAVFTGFWQARAEGPGYLQLNGEGRRAQLASVWRYMPVAVPVAVPAWLQQGLLGGRGEDVRLRLAGDLARFPFADGSGVFRVEAHAVDGVLNFATGWPGLSGVSADVLFERASMRIRSNAGRYQGVQTRDVTVGIQNLMASGAVLTVDGKASGPTADFLHYVNHSWLAGHAGDFTRGVQASGSGDLRLRLAVPLGQADKTRVQGDFRFAGNTLKLVPALPEFNQASGVLAFSERGVTLPSAEASFLGGRVRASSVNETDGSLRIDAQGTVPISSLNDIVANPVWERFSGSAPVKAVVRVRRQHASVEVSSELIGVTANLPAPLFKDAADAWPVGFSWAQDGTDEGAKTRNWALDVDQRLTVQWQERCAEGRCSFVRGVLGAGDSPPLPERGWRVAGRFQRLDVDPWRPVVDELLAGVKSGETQDETLAGAALHIGEMVVGGHRFDAVEARALRQDKEWVVRVDGPDIAGDLHWSSEGQGRLRARLERFALNPVPAGFEPVVVEPLKQRDLPALDIVAERFRLRGIELGRLEVEAISRENSWSLRNLAIRTPDMTLTGEGSWRRLGADPGTDLRFKLVSPDAGALLARLGHPGAMRGGTVDASGNVGWRGMPTSLHYPSLSGKVQLKIADGQFAKLEPGAGRLLGILSLQSLPRRLTLDFSDVFSEGFAFDTLSGTMQMTSGVLKTDDLEIRGPAARVFMTGSTNLAKEEHNLRVRIQPTLSETVAVGAAAVSVLNPVVGAATYLAQKILRDPVEKIFGYEYTISGPWSDPKIDKTEAPPSAATRR